jgi:hypothetical protein
MWEYVVKLNEFKCSEELLYMLDIEPGKKLTTFSELFDKIHLNDINIINSAFREAISKRKYVEFIIRQVKKDNSFKYLQIKVKPKLLK